MDRRKGQSDNTGFSQMPMQRSKGGEPPKSKEIAMDRERRSSAASTFSKVPVPRSKGGESPKSEQKIDKESVTETKQNNTSSSSGESEESGGAYSYSEQKQYAMNGEKETTPRLEYTMLETYYGNYNRPILEKYKAPAKNDTKDEDGINESFIKLEKNKNCKLSIKGKNEDSEEIGSLRGPESCMKERFRSFLEQNPSLKSKEFILTLTCNSEAAFNEREEKND